MHWKRIVRDYFTFSRKDRIGIMALVVMIILIYSLPYLSRKSKGALSVEEGYLLRQITDSMEKADITDTETERKGKTEPYNYGTAEREDFTAGKLFPFDPNTLSHQGWRELGLGERTISTILNYRNKGGKFYRKEDLKKIWGLSSLFYERVKEHIILPAPPVVNNEKPLAEKTLKKTVPLVSINTADTATFIALPGIGSTLATRIINFRDKLGGFYSITQVAETYGLSDSTFRLIKPYLILDGTVRMININTISRDALRKHPYFKWNLSNAIISYREQHGPFSQAEDLKKITLITDSIYSRLKPYITIQ